MAWTPEQRRAYRIGQGFARPSSGTSRLSGAIEVNLYKAMHAQYDAQRRAGQTQKEALAVLTGTLAEFKMNIKMVEAEERRNRK